MQLSPTSPSYHCPGIAGKVAAYSWTKNLSIIPSKDPFHATFRPSFWGTYRPPDLINDCLRPFAATASVFLHSPLTTHSHHCPETLHHTDLSSTIIDGRIPAASRALSIPSRFPTTIAATVARTCRKKITGKTCLYVRGDFPLEPRDWGIPRKWREEAAAAARGRWLKKGEAVVSVQKIWFPSGSRRWSRIPRLGGSPFLFFHDLSLSS